MEKDLLKKLLDVVSEQQSQQAEIDAEYNIFYALKIWSKEVTLHSRIIVDLLNPKGYHKMGATFLELFLTEVDLIGKFESDKAIEVVDEKGLDGLRRIDIFLKDSTGNVIVIENKIYAGDQELQLEDYHDFGLKQTAGDKEKLSVLYLTLTGTPPSSGSLGNLKDEDYQCISYSEHIIRWIDKCIDKSAENPSLNEVLKQYKTTIEYLTKTNMEQLTEILDVIESDNEYKNLISLSQKVTDINTSLASKFVEQLINELKELEFTVTEYQEKAYWIKTNYNPKDTNEMWFKIVPRGVTPWCGFVEYNSTELKLSDEALEKLKEVEGELTDKYKWWYINDKYNISDMKLSDIKLLLKGKSIDLVKDCASFIKSEIDKLNNYAKNHQ